MSTYLNLKRRFVERPTYHPDEIFAADISDTRLDWDEILKARIAIVVAPANYGKTTEMRERAGILRANLNSAIFVALRKVHERKSLKRALECVEQSAYDAWKEAPTVPLTVFVDSLDEASASNRDGIEYLLGDVAKEVGWPNGLIRWVISTRPAVLSASVLEKITSLLVVPYVATAKSVPDSMSTSSFGEGTSKIIREPGVEPEKMKIFSMASLDACQARAYLAGKHASRNAEDLLGLARERGLSGFMNSPGGLDVLVHTGLVSSPPNSLTEVYQRVVDIVQECQRSDARLEAAGGAKPDGLAQAAQKLASASQVCQLPNIEFADEAVVITEGVLSARKIVGDLLPDRILGQLLNTQLFMDAGFNQVKLYPDEISPFLGAQRLAGLVQSSETAHKLVQHFTWKAPTGEQGVYRQYLPLMGWLATLNPHCREELLKVEPQALAFFGDLRNQHIPTSAARQVLRESIRRLVEQGDRLGRGMFTLTSENFWQAGPAHLTTLLKELFLQYGNHHRARDALLDIATSSRSDALRGVVLEACGDSYQRLLQRSSYLGYILELGQPDDLAGLAVVLKADDSIREGAAATLMAKLGWSHLTSTELATLVHKQFGRGSGGFQMSYALDSGLTEAASDEQLYEFCRALVVRVARLRDGKRRPVRDRGRTDFRYVELVTETLAVLVRRTSIMKHKRVALLCLMMQRVLTDHVGSGNAADFRQALRENTSVRFELLSLNVKRAGTDENKLWSAAYGYESLCEITAADVDALNSAELTAVVKNHEETQAAHRAKPQAAIRASENRLTVSAKAKKDLQGMLWGLSSGTGTKGLTWVATWLLKTTPNSRYGDVEFGVFEQQVGSTIAQAVRDGLSKVWRTQAPKYMEYEPRSTFYLTIAGLQGLHLELGDGRDLPKLTGDEVRSALSYALFEINGYPRWFWRLVAAHPDLAGQELAQMVKQANGGPVSLEHAEGLLTSLGDAPPAIQSKLAPLAWTFIQERPQLAGHVVEKLLAVATEVAGVVAQKDFETLALTKMQSAFSGSVPSDEARAKAVQAERSQCVVWATSWLTGYPTAFRKVVDKWLKKIPLDAQALIFALAAHLGRDRSSKLVHLAQTSEEGVAALAALYDWTLAAVRPEDDKNHPAGKAYTVDDRDHAEQLRDALIPAIAAAKSQLAYEVIDRLRLAANGPRTIYLRNVQFEMREAQYARPPLSQLEYNDFERDFTANVTDTTSFAMAVQSDLEAVKYDIEKGDYSLRRFFTDIVLTQGKPTAEDEKDGLALEADFQRLLASELHHHAKGRYSVTVEPHTAEAKRRDVLCSKGRMFASIELKMSKRWTIDKYIEALDKQLVGQYMRHRDATTGFLVIVLQERDRYWLDPSTGEKIDFHGLLAMLGQRALELESKDRSRYLRIVGIDATHPENFRAVAKKTTTKPVAKDIAGVITPSIKRKAATAKSGVGTSKGLATPALAKKSKCGADTLNPKATRKTPDTKRTVAAADAQPGRPKASSASLPVGKRSSSSGSISGNVAAKRIAQRVK